MNPTHNRMTWLLTLSLTIFLYLGPTQVSASVKSGASLCFDFNTIVKTPIHEPLRMVAKSDASEAGRLSAPKNGFWGQVEGVVHHPIQKIYQQLLDHYTIKDPKRTKLKIYPQDRSGYLDFHLVMITLPTPVMDIKWEEQWGYAVVEGSEEQPKKVVISYQKTSGSSYIPHLCGSIVLKANGTNATDVYLYEEINALGKRSPDDIVKGHLGTLATLRK